MNLSSLRNQFRNTLHKIQPVTEIDNYFFLLAEFKLNLRRIDLALNPNQTITTEEHSFFNESLKLLERETPIQHIIGSTEFYGLPFKVTPDTLIPRPETEELVQWILDATSIDDPISILDIGTGSGCIAISLAKKLPKSSVTAFDISEKALEIASQNATLNEVSISFKNIDILKTNSLEEQYDIIASNPPYVRNLEKKEIKNNVLMNEPHTALFVTDSNPLLFYDKIGELAKKHLKPKGLLFFEINQYLGQETLDLLNQKGFSNTELRKDIFGNDRMILTSI